MSVPSTLEPALNLDLLREGLAVLGWDFPVDDSTLEQMLDALGWGGSCWAWLRATELTLLAAGLRAEEPPVCVDPARRVQDLGVSGGRMTPVTSTAG